MTDYMNTFVLLPFAESDEFTKYESEIEFNCSRPTLSTFEVGKTFATMFYDSPGCHCFPGGPNCPCLERENKESFPSGENMPRDWLFIRYEDFTLFACDIHGIESLCQKANLTPTEKRRAEELTEMIKSGKLKARDLEEDFYEDW